MVLVLYCVCVAGVALFEVIVYFYTTSTEHHITQLFTDHSDQFISSKFL